MKGLTVIQPWAWLIMHGPKRIENRTWRTAYRGPVLIHAGKSRSLLELAPSMPPPSAYTLGALLGVVELVDVVRATDPRAAGNPFAEGPWCWLLANPRPLSDPIPYTGERGLFDVDWPLATSVCKAPVDRFDLGWPTRP